MGYWIRSRDTSSTWSLRILLLVAAVITGLLGMHVLAGHGTPTAGQHAPHGPAVTAQVAEAPAMPRRTVSPSAAEAPTAHHAQSAPAHGCADCAEHESTASSCVLAPVAPATLPGLPAEDHRPAPAGVDASFASVAADPRPPSISALCISRR